MVIDDDETGAAKQARRDEDRNHDDAKISYKYSTRSKDATSTTRDTRREPYKRNEAGARGIENW